MTQPAPKRQPTRRQPTAGVTLIEMMIALALFALIGSAGFAMLDQVLRSASRSEGRLEVLSERQRALHLLLLDFAMADPRSLTTNPLSITRASSRGRLTLHYRLTGTTLHRELTGASGRPLADQALLTGVESLTWRYLAPDGGWGLVWPPSPVQNVTTPANPRAVELVVTLADGQGSLRRIAPLPADPAE